MSDDDQVPTRCPSCNPMHGTEVARRKAAKHKARHCNLCQGSQRVSVEVASRFLDALRGIGVKLTARRIPKTLTKVSQ